VYPFVVPFGDCVVLMAFRALGWYGSTKSTNTFGRHSSINVQGTRRTRAPPSENGVGLSSLSVRYKGERKEGIIVHPFWKSQRKDVPHPLFHSFMELPPLLHILQLVDESRITFSDSIQIAD